MSQPESLGVATLLSTWAAVNAVLSSMKRPGWRCSGPGSGPVTPHCPISRCWRYVPHTDPYHPTTPYPEAGDARAEHPLKLRALHALQSLLKTPPVPRIAGGLWLVQTGRQLEGRSCSQPPSAGGHCPSPFPGHLLFPRKGVTGTGYLRMEAPRGLGLSAKPQATMALSQERCKWGFPQLTKSILNGFQILKHNRRA